ncbi:site-2 protease family protein [Pseudonocardia sp. DSM 110487]|uniref:M50 family metallopeptidase n=1 Tax=Pseudonocardia sp. DSM 110487 TaxID=2865833 RepID=UPI001C69C077|nr:site-2 protease family protein [Pseudonocardia sp. DSM 110487]QYN33212.1 site-2 protease family protein [Pseudonocardia sp. DSM 110487]
MMFVLGILLLFAGIMISVAWHELGHYLAARKFGIKVPEFFVGFGKTVWSRKVGETEFGVKMIPLGGYVRMIGMLPPAKGQTLGRSRRTGPFQGLIDDARQQSAMDVMPEDAHRQFYTRAPWKRIIVMAAGPFQNLILAVILFAIAIMAIGVPTSSTTISTVSQCVLPATAPQTEQCPADAPPSPAAAAGLLPGDKIVAFDGAPVAENDWRSLQEVIRASSGTVTITVERGEQRLDLTPTLIRTQAQDLDDPERVVDVSFLGVTPVPTIARQGPAAVVVAVGDVIVRTAQAIVNLPERLPNLFGSAFLGSERDQDGPVGIVGVSRIGGEFLASEAFTATQQVLFLLNLLALVNISLFLFNMLPLPPLDGGQIFPAVWEAVKKRIARLRGKPDPGPVDSAKLLPIAYVVALLFIGWSAILLVADVVNPIQLPF